MDAPLLRWERFALIGVVLIGVIAVVWMAIPAQAVALEALRWDDIAPARDVGLRPWRWIVIHHSATAGGTAAGIDNEHREARGWEGIGYHLLIGNGHGTDEGRIEATFRWRNQEQGAHAGQQPWNEQGIGICLIGDYRTEPPSPLIERRLVELCALLIRHCPDLTAESIIGHRDVPGKNTECPGAGVDISRIRRLVADKLAEVR